MSAIRCVSLLIMCIVLCSTLRCRTGYRVIPGQSVEGPKEEDCGYHERCYNLTIISSNTALSGTMKAGCSRWRCKMADNKCREFDVLGYRARFCCCDQGDICNSKYTNLSTSGKIEEGLKEGISLLEKVWTKIPLLGGWK